MKKLFASVIAICFFISCNNSGDATASADSAAAPSTTNVENVNGNVADTTSGMTLNQSLPIDSSRLKDSLNR
jgi:acid phosphatase class B